MGSHIIRIFHENETKRKSKFLQKNFFFRWHQFSTFHAFSSHLASKKNFENRNFTYPSLGWFFGFQKSQTSIALRHPILSPIELKFCTGCFFEQVNILYRVFFLNFLVTFFHTMIGTLIHRRVIRIKIIWKMNWKFFHRNFFRDLNELSRKHDVEATKLAINYSATLWRQLLHFSTG